MRNAFFLIIGVFLIAIIFNTSCQLADSSDAKTYSYVDSLIQVRQKMDLELKNGKNSPIPASKRERFVGLKHFPASELWCISAQLIALDSVQEVEIATTDGKSSKMWLAFQTKFKIDTVIYALNGYVDQGNPTSNLFIPFYDLTNGEDTYGGGRFLNVKLTETDSVFLDFNLAYNPYCHYNHEYTCPIPPVENFLDTRIEAGEKKLY